MDDWTPDGWNEEPYNPADDDLFECEMCHRRFDIEDSTATETPYGKMYVCQECADKPIPGDEGLFL